MKNDVSVSLYQKNLSKGIKTWYARVKRPGDKNPSYISLGTTSRSEATAILAANIAAGVYEGKSVKNITLGECIEKFIANRTMNHIKDGSLDNYRMILGVFASLEERHLHSIDRDTVLEVFNEKCKDFAANTYNHHKTICKGLFSFIYNELEIEYKNPFARIKNRKKVPKFEKNFWTMEQIEILLDNATNKDERMYWAFMAYAGLRKNEAAKIKREDIHDGKIFVIGKGDKPAAVPICQKLQDELDLYGDEEFNFAAKKLIHHRKRLQRIVERTIGNDNASANFHRFRHSFGSNLIRAKANIKSVQMLMRHSSITLTLNTYSHLLESDLIEEVNLLK